MPGQLVNSNINFLEQGINDENTPLLPKTTNVLTSIEVTSWWGCTMNNIKLVGKGVLALTSVVVLKTAQRGATVVISSEGPIDWDRLLEIINPTEDILEFGFTIPQLMISIWAMDGWKWGVTKIFDKFRSLATNSDFRIETTINTHVLPQIEDLHNSNPNPTIQAPIDTSQLTPPESYCKLIPKVIFYKTCYWVPNHFMITASSMYSVKSLTNFQAYLEKILSPYNIGSTFIRAEVLLFVSDLLRYANKNFSKMNRVQTIIAKICSLLQKLNFFKIIEDMSAPSRCQKIMKFALEITSILAVMACVVVVDNGIKTALVMYTAGKINEFCSTFFNLEMLGIMIGLICSDTLGNKICNPVAKKKIMEIWNKIKVSCSNRNNDYQVIEGDCINNVSRKDDNFLHENANTSNIQQDSTFYNEFPGNDQCNRLADNMSKQLLQDDTHVRKNFSISRVNP